MKTHLAKAALYLFFILPQFLMAQDTYSISGRVVDFEEQPITGAKVFIVDGDSTITNGNGEYVFENQRARGDYQVFVSKNDGCLGKVDIADKMAIATKESQTQGPGSQSSIDFFYELPYDVDCVNGLNRIDIITLSELILGDPKEFECWAFISKSIDLIEPYDESRVFNFIQIDSLESNSRHNDFYGYIKGDIIKKEELGRTNSIASLILEDIEVCSEKVILPVKIRSESFIKDMQFGLKFANNEIEFVRSIGFITNQKDDHIYAMKSNSFGCDTLYEGFLEFRILDPETNIKIVEFEYDDFPLMVISCDNKLMKTEEQDSKIAVTEPILSIGFEVQGSYEFDCGDEAVEICFSPVGGIAPYQINWENGLTDTCRIIDESTQIELIVSDSRGCKLEYSQFVSIVKPEEIWLPFTDVWHPTHSTSGDGYIRINNTFGGTFPFQYKWSNGDTGYHIENLNAGSYTVTVTDSKDCQFVKTYTLVAPIATSTNAAFAESSNIQIHPNPSVDGSGQLQIEVTQPQEGQVEIFELSGKKVYEQGLQIESVTKTVALDMHLPKGVYLIKVQLELEGIQTIRWVVQ